MSTLNAHAYKIFGMDCAEEIAALRREVGPVVGGADRLSFDLLNAKMTVISGATPDAVIGAVARTGMKAIPWERHVDAQVRGATPPWWNRHAHAAMSILSGACTLLGLALHASRVGLAPALAGGESPNALSIACYAVATVAGGWFVVPKAFFAVRRFRADMNVLMTVAVIGAIILGEWFEAASVAFLFSFALLLESWSIRRARTAIQSLLNLAPQTARFRCPTDGDIEEKPVDRVSVGAEVLVRPGERIPLDGVMTRGTTTVNQAPITGESAPVDKAPGDTVYAGSINNEGSIEFRVTRAVSDTTLARIVRMIEEAQSRRAPSEQWVESFAKYYTPAMMALALAIALVPPLFMGDWSRWFYEALVVLVIACPCALVISTPVSIVAGLATAARNGVLIKGGAFLEQAALVNAVAMDKTGTLTRGALEVQRIVPLNGRTADEVLARAAALEAHSDHPIARAISDRARRDAVAIPEAQDFRALQGRGAEAIVNGTKTWVGSHRMLHETSDGECAYHDVAEGLEDAGHSIVAVGSDSTLLGFISLADSIRADAAQSVAALKHAGIVHVRMLTGDNYGTAKAIADAAAVDSFDAELLPEDKVEAVTKMVREYGTVAMIGDGVNDAPAMAAASLGIAMAAVGSDAANETADIALMSDDLSRVPWLIAHARRTRAIIRQNIVFALGVKLVFLALALGGFATLWMAIAADMGASLLVIFNALRLLRD